MEELIETIHEASGVEKELIEKHFGLFLEKIDTDSPIDLEKLEIEFVKTLLKIKEDSDGSLQQ